MYKHAISISTHYLNISSSLNFNLENKKYHDL